MWRASVLHLSVCHVRAHAVVLHRLTGKLRHRYLSQRTVVASHLSWLIARTVLHAVTRATRERHARVKVLSVTELRAVLRHVGEAWMLSWVVHVRSLEMSRELMSMRHRPIC